MPEPLRSCCDVLFGRGGTRRVCAKAWPHAKATTAGIEEAARKARHQRRLTFEDVEQQFAEAGDPLIEAR